ncbi:GGDEF domain-containing protein [Paenibacillus sp. 19GGS1-52]|uniref:GGDEF domain-containing protein n=1 Tax=Paenibacillus sp. 19GGS1-52 TaxID=2758563 RepID=UPI001EFC0D69|nr:GGDEF domain-containing protein [Paenibacillus sp. 19GGS1-52]ULO08668.1 GGDEF domain-containing protein [Paenibacillus sp. 19GGS1-52]
MKFISIYLDLMTLQVCLLAGNLVTVVLVLAYRSRYAKESTSSLFVAAKCLQISVLILLLLKDFIDSRITATLSSLLGLAGGTTEALAILMLLGVYTTKVKRYYYLLAGFSAAVILFLIIPVSDQVQLRIAMASLLGSLFIIYPVYCLLTKGKDSPLQKVMGLLYCIVMMVLIIGAVVGFISVPLNTHFSQLLNWFFYIGLYLLMFLGTAGFTLLSREQSYVELERVATYDELTGILNRRAFVLRARPLIAAAAKEGIAFSFLLLDVDHFKNVNDTYGHDTGDRVLKDFASKIEQQLANGDLFGRFGGEEFAVILHRADEQASDEIAERLRTAILGAVINGVPLHYTVSIGVITVVSTERFTLNNLYKLSDTALYQAKQKGRNCVVRSYG